MFLGTEVQSPTTFLNFCARHPLLCSAQMSNPQPITLTPARFEQIADVNRTVNSDTRYMTDIEQYGRTDYWDHTHLGAGDCEDFALEKQDRLMAVGWPVHVLLLARVRMPRQTLHCVLVVVTDRGDYALDNVRRQPPLPWFRLPYRWIMRQSMHAYRRWVEILPER